MRRILQREAHISCNCVGQFILNGFRNFLVAAVMPTEIVKLFGPCGEKFQKTFKNLTEDIVDQSALSAERWKNIMDMTDRPPPPYTCHHKNRECVRKIWSEMSQNPLSDFALFHLDTIPYTFCLSLQCDLHFSLNLYSLSLCLSLCQPFNILIPFYENSKLYCILWPNFTNSKANPTSHDAHL